MLGNGTRSVRFTRGHRAATDGPEARVLERIRRGVVYLRRGAPNQLRVPRCHPGRIWAPLRAAVRERRGPEGWPMGSCAEAARPPRPTHRPPDPAQGLHALKGDREHRVGHWEGIQHGRRAANRGQDLGFGEADPCPTPALLAPETSSHPRSPGPRRPYAQAPMLTRAVETSRARCRGAVSLLPRSLAIWDRGTRSRRGRW